MTDLSKVADLVLLLIDASYGFEMETFEFLNQLQIHGFPKVIGVMTHLDGFINKNKMLQVDNKSTKQQCQLLFFTLRMQRKQLSTAFGLKYTLVLRYAVHVKFSSRITFVMFR